MLNYKLIKVTIDASGLTEVIIHIVVKNHDMPNLIVSDPGSIFTSKFWLLLRYFLGIKLRFSTTFHPQTDSQTKRQNSSMETYFRAFVNYKQNDWARPLPMAEFGYNNVKNTNTGYTPFELNYDFHPRVSYEEDVDPRSRSKTANQLATEL